MQARVFAGLRVETWTTSHPPATSHIHFHSRKCTARGWTLSPSLRLGRQRSTSTNAALWDGRQGGDLGLLSITRPVWESSFWWSMNFAAVLLAAAAALYISRPRGWVDNYLVECGVFVSNNLGLSTEVVDMVNGYWWSGRYIPTVQLDLSGPCVDGTSARQLAYVVIRQVQESQVQGLGVFARRDIPAGTLLGVYPGRPRPPHEMAAKARQAPGARDYAFRTPSGAWLDPTDAEGRVSAAPRPGLPWFDIDPALTRVNEPPPGQSVNVEVVTNGDPLEIRFVTLRDVARGEELFIDYGTSYDRSGYK